MKAADRLCSADTYQKSKKPRRLEPAGLFCGWCQLQGSSACSFSLGLGFVQLLLQFSSFSFGSLGFGFSLGLGLSCCLGFRVVTTERACNGVARNGADHSANRCSCDGAHHAATGRGRSCCWGCCGCRSRCCRLGSRSRCDWGSRLGRCFANGRGAHRFASAHAFGVGQRRRGHGSNGHGDHRSGGAKRCFH